jgi:hypothetical protein
MHLKNATAPGACARRSGTMMCVESNRPAGDIESISRDLVAARVRQTHGENSQGPRSRARPCQFLSRLRVKTAEPGKMYLNARSENIGHS